MKSIIVNDRYVGDFYSVTTVGPTVINSLMVGDKDVTREFITDPTQTLPQGSTIYNDIAGGNYFTEITVKGTVVMGIK